MGIFKRAVEKRMRSALSVAPYTGGPHPPGAIVAIPFPGAIEVELPQGGIKLVYRCKGQSNYWEQTGGWRPPGVEITCQPVDGLDEHRLRLAAPSMPMQKVSSIGDSWLVLFVGEVPAPGIVYRFAVDGPVADDEAHLRIEKH